jgi:hypothetical protein
METPAKRGPGRPPKPEGEVKRAFYQARIREAVKAFLELEAKAAGRSLSEEIEVTLEQRVAAADRAPLVNLLDEVISAIDPRGRWRENSPIGEAVSESIVRGAARLIKRLRAPDDAHVFRDGSVEAKVDELLWDLGNDGTEHRGPLTHVHHWSAQIRRRLGPLGPLLIKMRRAVREHLESMPPSEPAQPKPEHVEIWDKPLAAEHVATAEHRSRGAEAAGEARRRARRAKE